MSDDRKSFDALIARVDFTKGNGIVPAVVQDAASGKVLMLAYMNREALAATIARRRVVFFSRSRQRLWEKGETSGHTLDLERIDVDCDGDTLLVTARPRGPVCHTGTPTCFGDPPVPAPRSVAFLATLEQIIADRDRERERAAAAGSYTAKLLAKGTRRVAQKVGEEGVESALAGVGGSTEELIGESADLVFHLLVLLRSRGIALESVVAELERRHRSR